MSRELLALVLALVLVLAIVLDLVLLRRKLREYATPRDAHEDDDVEYVRLLDRDEWGFRWHW